MAKVSKQSVNYSRGHKDSHCGKVFPDDKGYCRHYIPHTDQHSEGACQLVQGSINPVYWCEKWQRQKQ